MVWIGKGREKKKKKEKRERGRKDVGHSTHPAHPEEWWIEIFVDCLGEKLILLGLGGYEVKDKGQGNGG